jgi:hypothetical protein
MLCIIGSTFAQQSVSIQWMESSNNSRLKDSYFNQNVYNDKFYGVIRSDIQDINSLPLNIDGYAGDGAFYFSIDKDKIETIPSTKQLGFLPPSQKLSQDIVKLYATSTASDYDIQVRYYENTPWTSIENACNSMQINPWGHNEDFARFYAKVSYSDIEKLAELPFIKFISFHLRTSSPLLYDGFILNNMYGVSSNTPNSFNLYGKNINIGVWDGGIVGPHVDFRDHVTNIDKDFYALGSTNHASHVVGAIVGSGLINMKIRGMAPEAKVFVRNYEKDDLVSEFKTAITQQGVLTNNHSYYLAGPYPFYCGFSGLYVTESADLDYLVRQNPTVTEVFAVGNSGSLCGPYNTIVPGFQGAKNIITVGWTDLNDTLWVSSSTGPTVDGRLKPDVVAKGANVSSTYINDNYGGAWGSSHSAPQVTGITALMYEQYRKQLGTNPTAALIKSILLNTAKDLGNPGPDYRYGFGQVDALEAIKTISENRFSEGNVTNAAQQTLTINVPDGMNNLKVMLVWTDKEASLPISKVLVNNLDLEVITPSGDIVTPLILDPSNPSFSAYNGVDSLNNVEQVTIPTPLPGTYTIRVKGSKVPFSSQSYALSWNFRPPYIAMTFPKGGEILQGGVAERLRWEGLGIGTNPTIEVSIDSGSTWTIVAADIDYRNILNYWKSWTVPNSYIINKAFVRITSGDLQFTSEPFSILPLPTLSVSSQCENTITLSVTGTSGANYYKIYQISDTGLISLGTTSNTLVVKNLAIGKKVYFSASAVKNEVEGRRSVAISTTPDINNCSRTQDIGAWAISEPLGGRTLTTSALGNEKIKVIVKNYGSNALSNYTVSYTLNNIDTQSVFVPGSISARDTEIVTFPIIEDFSALGNYTIKVWTSATADNFKDNDTQTFIIRHVDNPLITLPYYEGFEAASIELLKTTMASIGFDALDFNSDSIGRLRTNEYDGMPRTGNRCMTIDNFKSGSMRTNEAIITLNLSKYIDSVLFMDFSYMHRGEKNDGDKVFIRGSDTDNWIEIYDLYSNRIDSGFYKYVQNINLTKFLKTLNNQNYSTSTQIKVVYIGNNVAQDRFNFGGYTFDDFKIYNAGKDIGLINAIAPALLCEGQQTTGKISVDVVNNTPQAITNPIVYYSINNETIQRDTFFGIIAAGDTAKLFLNKLNSQLVAGNNIIKVYVNSADNFRSNDTANAIHIAKFNTIPSFPYFENFEKSDANFVADGKNNSWAWGTPAKRNIKGSVSGTKSWVTDLSDRYNSFENASITFGCINMDELFGTPMISFQHTSELEQGYDDVLLEYSYDYGSSWKTLGSKNSGYNWYNSDSATLHWDKTKIPWQVASNFIPLPISSDSTTFAVLRYRLRSDQYANYDGFALDDIHIFENPQNIATQDSIVLIQVSSGNGLNDILNFSGLVAQVDDRGQNLGIIRMHYNARPRTSLAYNNNYLLSRSWSLEPENLPTNSVKVRLYFRNEEFLQYAGKFEDSIRNVYNLKLFRYNSYNINAEYYDNLFGQGEWIDSSKFKIYPYNDGYYLEFETSEFGEFYLIDDRYNPTAYPFANISKIEAKKFNSHVLLDWSTANENNAKWFIVEYSIDGLTFGLLDTVFAEGTSTSVRNYSFFDNTTPTRGIIFYRVKAFNNTNSYLYSLMDTVDFTITPIKEYESLVTSFINDQLQIIFSSSQTSSGILSLYDMNGKLIYQKNLRLLQGYNYITDIPAYKMSAGEYIIQYSGNNNLYWSGKAIKLR